LAFLTAKLATYTVDEYLLCKEEHDDKSKHVHVHLQLHRISDIKSEDFLDILFEDTRYHGNYQKCKKIRNIINYLLKGVQDLNSPDILMSKNMRSLVDNLGTLMGVDEALIQLAEKGQIAEAMAVLRKHRPEQYVKSHMFIEKSLKAIRLKTLGCTAKFNFNQFVLPENLKDGFSFVEKNKRSLHLIGDSGSGKSQIINAYAIEKRDLTPLTINNFDALRFFDSNKHNALIIDDPSKLKKLSREELIKLFDSEDATTFDLKHGSVQIPANTPRFIITNSALSAVVDKALAQDPAINRRIFSVDIRDLKLYIC
jgi:hypothetical protein